jgi:hypothetical protein
MIEKFGPGGTLLTKVDKLIEQRVQRLRRGLRPVPATTAKRAARRR